MSSIIDKKSIMFAIFNCSGSINQATFPFCWDVAKAGPFNLQLYHIKVVVDIKAEI